MSKTKRAKYVLEFVAAMEEKDLESIRDLWEDNSDDITRRLLKREVIAAYSFFERHEMWGEREELYKLAIKYNHSAAQELTAAEYIGR